MIRMPHWRAAMIRALKDRLRAAQADGSGQRDLSAALRYLRGTSVSERASDPDFKIVVRWNSDRASFAYNLCYGSCGYSANDHNIMITISEDEIR